MRLTIAATVAALALAPTASASARSTPTPTTRTTSYAVVVVKDSAGDVLSRTRYPASSQHRTLNVGDLIATDTGTMSPDGHGTSGTASSSGSATFTLHQTGHSTLGYHLWTIKIQAPNVYWGNGYLGVPGYGTTAADHKEYRHKHRSWETQSTGVQWDGWKAASSYFYRWNPDKPGSGFHLMAQGEFTVPNALSGLNYEYPKNTLNLHGNGTYEWWTSCCGN